MVFGFITTFCIEYTSPWVGFKLTMLVVIDIDCTGSYKSKYHMTTTTMTPSYICCYNTNLFFSRLLDLPSWKTSIYFCVETVTKRDYQQKFSFIIFFIYYFKLQYMTCIGNQQNINGVQIYKTIIKMCCLIRLFILGTIVIGTNNQDSQYDFYVTK
jgi:hypothetical protein